MRSDLFIPLAALDGKTTALLHQPTGEQSSNGETKKIIEPIASTSKIQTPYNYKRTPINFTMEDLENSSEEEGIEYEVNSSPNVSTRLLPKRSCQVKIVQSSDSDTDSDTDSNIYEYPESDVQYDAEDKDQPSLSENCDDYENDSTPRFSL